MNSRPDLVAPPALSGAHAPNEEDARAISVGLDLLRSLSAFDIGQAAIVAREHVLAVEGPEGTDRMLGQGRGACAGPCSACASVATAVS